MKGFYIKQIAASGSGKALSSIDFSKGLNIIHGPSNTGKSFVIGVIDFMFCGKKPTFDELTGYTVFSMTIETYEGYSLQFTRKIDENKVRVDSSVPEIESKEYKISNYELSDVFLKLIGIDKPHNIIRNQNMNTSRLTLRTFIHMFLVEEESTISKDSIVRHGGYNLTPTLAALLFLITGEDASNVIKNESKEIKEARKRAIVGYINKQIKRFEEQNSELNEKLIMLGNDNVEDKIQNIVSEIDQTERKIIESAKKSKQLLKSIYTLSGKLEEAEFMNDRYDALETQYQSDVKRLNFIIDGEKSKQNTPIVTKCPFCSSDMKVHNHRSYIVSAEKELEKLQAQIADLAEAKKDIEQEIEILSKRLNALEIESDDIKILTESELKPHLKELEVMLDEYQKIQKIKNEMAFIKNISGSMSADAFAEENEEESESKYVIKDHFGSDITSDLNKCLDETLKECAYKDYLTSRIDWSIFDIVVNAGKKASEGKGYRGFLNTVFAITLMKYLSQNAKYAPRMLILDSPITNLKEAEGDEGTKNSMKAALFKCLISSQKYGQIIIAENDIPDIDYTKINIIQFTKNKSKGRYGFLKNPNLNEEK